MRFQIGDRVRLTYLDCDDNLVAEKGIIEGLNKDDNDNVYEVDIDFGNGDKGTVYGENIKYISFICRKSNKCKSCKDRLKCITGELI